MDKLLEEINGKLDLILLKLNKNVVKENVYSISEYKEAILVNFTFNEKFKNIIKEAGGKWVPTKSSWMFPKTRLDEIKELITENLPEYSLKN